MKWYKSSCYLPVTMWWMTLSANAAFDVQSSWFRSSQVEAAGSALSPDDISQDISGDPQSSYTETYTKSVISNDAGSLNSAYLAYTLSADSSPQGVVSSFSFNADATVFSQLSGTENGSANFTLSTATEFTTSSTFTLEAVLLQTSALVNDFSLWVDDVQYWSVSDGFLLPADVGGTEGTVTVYGQGSDFEMTFYALENGASSGLYGLGLDVIYGGAEPSHKFEVRSNWDALEDASSFVDFSLDFSPDLQFSVVPEVSQFWLPGSVLVAISLTRKKSYSSTKR